MSHVFIRSGLDHIDSTYASLSGTPEAKYAELVKHRNFDEKELLALLDQLKPVCPENFIGIWTGSKVNTKPPQ
ncbi:hypothetical protein N7468_008839 [Penicillium chermesinum]|uniref:Uncharacterized protein n=1 Tax=Penicillium chermesinum TaxID=63820 RepID=A0A9W9TFJ1_9EURO|nr:uncharacterized protein N7468_008839 [Penicillium chermesinum]KAJ5219635.1 hypothetical protein N7468_008839 [Penicillium chermesinum]